MSFVNFIKIAHLFGEYFKISYQKMKNDSGNPYKTIILYVLQTNIFKIYNKIYKLPNFLDKFHIFKHKIVMYCKCFWQTLLEFRIYLVNISKFYIGKQKKIAVIQAKKYYSIINKIFQKFLTKFTNFSIFWINYTSLCTK